MTLSRRQLQRRLLAGAAFAVAATGAHAQPRTEAHLAGTGGQVFTSTNSAAGNELLVYGAGSGGTLALQARLQTQGLGTSAGLGSQGAVTLSGDGRWLFVVNAGSSTVSTFAIRGNAIGLASVHDSGGLQPTSVSEHDGLVYVLNAGGAGNVAGFRNDRGQLTPVEGGVQPLSAAGGTGPAQVGIGTEGDVLVVTEKATNRLTSYPLAADGSAGAPIVTASAGTTPFGFAFDRRNHLLVSEAFAGGADASALSSYRFDAAAPAVPLAVSRSVPTGQTAACWAVVTPNGRWAYTANAGSGSLSLFAIDRLGGAVLVDGVAADTGPDSGPIDTAITPNGRALHVLAGRVSTIFSYAIGRDGTLTATGSVAGVPAGSVGLAAN